MSDQGPLDRDDPASRVAHGFEVPSEEMVDAVLLRIGDPQLRRSFFAQLQNPNWIGVLVERNALTTPQVTESAEGRNFHSPWPEGDYLARMAPAVPHEVIDVLESISDTENWFAQGSIIKAAAGLPPELATRLVPAICTFIRGPAAHDPVDITNALLNVITSDDWPAVRPLLVAVFEPREIGEREGVFGPRREVGAGIEEYWFAEALPRMTPLLTEHHRYSGVRTLVAWLERWQELMEHYSSETGRDVSSATRPSIAPHAQNHGVDELGDALVDAVRDSVVQLMRLEGPAAGLRPLANSPQPLLQRIAMYATAAVATEPASEIAVPDLLAVAKKWLTDPEYLDYTYRVEYSTLIGALAEHMTQDEVDRWIAMVNAYDFADSELIAELLADGSSAPHDVSDEEIEQYRGRCRRDLVAAISSENLPARLVEYREGLVRAHGEAREHVEFAAWSESFVGPTSPLSTDELGALSIPDLVTYLSTWSPAEDRVFGPSAEGVGRQVTDRVQSAPEEFAAEARSFIGLEATYVRSVVQGLDRALRDDRPELEWASVLALCEYVVSQPRGSDDSDYDLERDQNWIWARNAVASLLSTAAGANTLRQDFWEHALELLAALADDPQPTPEYEARYGGDNMNPLTLSLNTVRPVAVRAVVRLYLANRALPEPVGAVEERALRVLDAHLGVESDPSLAVQAVFGEHLGRLVSEAADDWIGDRLSKLLGDPTVALATVRTPGPDAVWSTMLATYRPGPWIVAALSDFLVQRVDAVAGERAEVVGWKQQRTPNQLLGDWLVTLFVRDEVDGPSNPDGLIARYFGVAAPGLCAEVLEHLGWVLGRSSDVPSEVLSRAQELWDWRSAIAQSDQARAGELSGFGSWIRSDQFPASWWVPRLRAVIDVTELGVRIGLGEALASAARIGYASEALEIAEALLNDRSDFATYDLIRHLPVTLAAALQHQDAAVRRRASSMLEKLGREGHLDLADKVAQARSSI